MGGRPESPTTIIRRRQRCGYGTRAGGETRRVGGEQGSWEKIPKRQTKTRRRWPSLTTVISPFFLRVGPQWRSSQPWPVLLTFRPFTFPSLTLYLSYSSCTYLYVQAQDIYRCPSLDISIVHRALPSLYGYWYNKVCPRVFHQAPDTTEPIGSSCLPWNIFIKRMNFYNKKTN